MSRFHHTILFSTFLLFFHFHHSVMDDWMTVSYEECENLLKRLNSPLSGPSDGSIYCNATWDSILCWPATPAGHVATHRCPSLRGLNATKYVKKQCHHSGRWLGRNDEDFDDPHGFTNYTSCFVFNLNIERMSSIAESAVSIEYAGLIFSFFAILIALFKSRSFPAYLQNQRRHILISLLILISLRLLLYIDVHYHWPWKYLFADEDGSSITNQKILCELIYAFLEMMKIVPAVFLALESFSTHKAMNSDNGINDGARTNLMVGYGIPFATIAFWIFVIFYKNDHLEQCLGPYYIQGPYVIPIGCQILGITISILLAMNVLCTFKAKLNSKENPNYCTLKKNAWISIIVAIWISMHLIVALPFSPNSQKINQFRNFVYLTSILSSFQGFSIAMIYLIWGRAQNESSPQVPINQ